MPVKTSSALTGVQLPPVDAAISAGVDGCDPSPVGVSPSARAALRTATVSVTSRQRQPGGGNVVPSLVVPLRVGRWDVDLAVNCHVRDAAAATLRLEVLLCRRQVWRLRSILR